VVGLSEATVSNAHGKDSYPRVSILPAELSEARKLPSLRQIYCTGETDTPHSPLSPPAEPAESGTRQAPPTNADSCMLKSQVPRHHFESPSILMRNVGNSRKNEKKGY
jgi:hypothetical protein